MVRSGTPRKILGCILGGVVAGITEWLLNFTTWFHGDGFSWWHPIAFGCVFAVLTYFVAIPLSEKEQAKRERKKREREKIES